MTPPPATLPAHHRAYRYVGPPDIRDAARSAPPGTPVASAAELSAWLGRQPDPAGPFTYTVGTDGVLRLADRRSEHVACAGGGAVLAAGEMGFAAVDGGGHRAVEVSNLSTGYCPDTACWPAVAAALERAGAGHPGGLTHPVVFRRCPACGEVSVVQEGFFVCVFCDSDLPSRWNVAPPVA
ncbi:hypothetical protein ACFY00_13705 [Kitasatospora sp. NPDC001540]|uniref:hypothetical protein n=1 Tax=Kitasatospora sp. NPDC001540 TaxID=3364014 RepID=UPI0036B99631